MSEAEKLVAKDMAHYMVDKALPALVAAEEEKLPDSVKGVVKLIVDAMLPKMQAAADAYIDAKLAAAQAASAPVAQSAPVGPAAQ